jgi:hypothetical protein
MSDRAARDHPHPTMPSAILTTTQKQTSAHTRLPPSRRKSNADERRGAAAVRLANDPSYTQTTRGVAAAELRSR